MKKISRIMLVAVAMLMCMSYCNEVKAATTEVVFGQEYSGVINDTNSSHGYKITLVDGGYLTMSYEVDEDFYWEIYGNNSRLDWDIISYGNYTGSVGVRLDPGTYYFYVYKPYFFMDAITYKIHFSFSKRNETFTYANDFISDVSSKSAIPYSTLINGQSSLTEITDYYKIVLPKQGAITIDVTLGSDNVDATLHDKNGNQINRVTSSYESKQSKTVTLAKGTYYIKFDSIYQDRTGWYDFKVSYSQSALKTFSLKKASNKSMVVKANKAGAISGYEIRYKKGSGKWKNINVGGSKKLNKTIKKLSKGKKYTVQIRTYYKYSGKILYSDWSAKKRIKL